MSAAFLTQLGWEFRKLWTRPRTYLGFAATFVLFGMGIWVLSIVVRPATTARVAVVAGMIGLFLLMIALPRFQQAFDLDVPELVIVMAIIGVVSCGGALMEVGWRIANAVGPWRPWKKNDEAE